MTRFSGVRLRSGLGWVNLREGTVYTPHDGASFAAPGANAAYTFFSVVDCMSSPGATAVLVGPKRLLVGDEAEAACARHLRAAGYRTVASVGCDAPARRRGARFVRVGGEECALVVKAPVAEAARLAEELRQRVEALRIPFSHPEVRTAGRVTVSIGLAPVHAGAPLREQLEEAVDAAKRAGRNTVQVGR